MRETTRKQIKVKIKRIDEVLQQYFAGGGIDGYGVTLLERDKERLQRKLARLKRPATTFFLIGCGDSRMAETGHY